LILQNAAGKLVMMFLFAELLEYSARRCHRSGKSLLFLAAGLVRHWNASLWHFFANSLDKGFLDSYP